jgi:negative regulator of flagellin synthesis FlgM
MAINTNNLNTNNAVQIAQQKHVQQQTAQSTSANNQVKASPQDSVSITPQAQQLSELQKKAADEPIVNQKKIEELKKAISAGEYKVDPEKLAASIANFEFKLV